MKVRTLKLGVAPVNPRPIGMLLTEQAARNPTAPALTIGGVTVLRSELESRANRLARVLQRMGVEPNDRVSIVLPNGFQFHETAFAIWKVGATPAPVSAKLPDHELAAILDLTQPRVVVGISSERAGGRPTIPLGFVPDQILSDAALPPAMADVWKATTSGGSTGRPKLILTPQPAQFDPDAVGLGIERDDVVLNPAPLYHNAPFGQTHRALSAGAHLIEMERFEPEETLRLIEQHRVRWLYMVPTMMNRIWALPDEVRNRYDLSSLEMVIHMAAMCPAWLKQAWIDWLGPDKIWEVYAGTEGLGGTVINGREWLEHKGSVGQVERDRVRILGEDGAACGPRDIGEIYFLPPGGAGSTYAYVGAEAKSVGGWQSYGDMGFLDEDDYLYLADRRTDMIISGGANIFPAEVEGALDLHPAIGSSVVVGLPDPDLGHRTHAIIQLRTGATLSLAELETFLSGRLARYKLPYTLEIVPDPLRDDSGKVRRSALRDDCIARAASGERFASLRSGAEA